MSLTNFTAEELQILVDNADAVTGVSNYIADMHTLSHDSFISNSKPYEPSITIGSVTLTEAELIALKELLKSTNPELYI